MINDNFITGLAKLLNAESYTLPSHLAFGSTDGVLSTADINCSGEFDRNAATKSRTSTTVKFIGSRLSTEVATSSGELISNVALVNSSVLGSSGNIQANFLMSSLLHTTNFDVDVEFWININRG